MMIVWFSKGGYAFLAPWFCRWFTPARGKHGEVGDLLVDVPKPLGRLVVSIEQWLRSTPGRVHDVSG